MDANQPKQKNSAALEYFLYAAIVVETGLAAFVYKTIFHDPDLDRLKVYFGIFYCAFLAWSIAQLNKIYRRRRLVQEEPAEIHEAVPEPTPSPLGLTTTQLTIVVVVFVTAVVTFSWALKLLR